MLMLEVTNLTKTKIDLRFLSKAARAAFAVLVTPSPPAGGEGVSLEIDISLVLVGEAKIRELNKKYRHKDKVTDVLSFEDLNEIFICLPQAKKQSQLLKTPLKTELTRLLVHGIVHLKGYDHEKSEKEAGKIRKLEDKILNLVF